MRTQTASEVSESAKVQTAAQVSEGPNKRVKAGHRSENSLGAPLTAVYSALLAKLDAFKGHYDALMFKNQCILSLTKEARKLRAKVADIEKSNAAAKSATTKGQINKRPIVAEKRVIALETTLMEAQDAQKRSVSATGKS